MLQGISLKFIKEAMMRRLAYILLGAALTIQSMGQPMIIDRVVGVVGDFNTVLVSLEKKGGRFPRQLCIDDF